MQGSHQQLLCSSVECLPSEQRTILSLSCLGLLCRTKAFPHEESISSVWQEWDSQELCGAQIQPNPLLFCRSEQPERHNCSGKLKTWCLNCVVSASCCHQTWLWQLWCSEEFWEQQTELVTTLLHVKEGSQMALLCEALHTGVRTAYEEKLSADPYSLLFCWTSLKSKLAF